MAYNEFAYFYDALNGAADYEALFRYVDAQLRQYGAEKGTIVDLGCGTGELTLMLAQAGYDMIAVDQSEEMLSVARDKAEQLYIEKPVLFLRQDILRLDLFGSITGAVSTFDTYNHIEDLDAAIKSAAFYMEKGGVFLVDLNTPYKHQYILGNNTFEVEDEEARCVWSNHYNEATGCVEIAVRIQYNGEEEIVEEFVEYTHTLDSILACLTRYGFSVVDLRDGETFASLQPDSQRYIITALKQYDQMEGYKDE